jgi:hypothetical protein
MFRLEFASIMQSSFFRLISHKIIAIPFLAYKLIIFKIAYAASTLLRIVYK